MVGTSFHITAKFIILRNYDERLKISGLFFIQALTAEVVLNSFINWGDDCFTKFNGMFAFAIWDRQEEILTLSRDRYGIKPLYYTHQQLFSHSDRNKRLYSKTRMLEMNWI